MTAAIQQSVASETKRKEVEAEPFYLALILTSNSAAVRVGLGLKNRAEAAKNDITSTKRNKQFE